MSRQSRTSLPQLAHDLIGCSGARTSREPDLAKTFAETRRSTTARGRTVRRPAPLARGTGVRRQRRTAAVPAPLRRRRTRRTDRRPALVPRVRRHLLLRRRVARRRLPRRDRGLLRRRTRSTSPTRLRDRAEHVLAIEVACPPQRDRGAKRTITGGYWQSPLLDPDLNPGGSGDPCDSRRPDRCASTRMRVLCTEASVERGRLACNLDARRRRRAARGASPRGRARTRTASCCSTRGARDARRRARTS